MAGPQCTSTDLSGDVALKFGFVPSPGVSSEALVLGDMIALPLSTPAILPSQQMVRSSEGGCCAKRAQLEPRPHRRSGCPGRDDGRRVRRVRLVLQVAYSTFTVGDGALLLVDARNGSLLMNVTGSQQLEFGDSQSSVAADENGCAYVFHWITGCVSAVRRACCECRWVARVVTR